MNTGVPLTFPFHSVKDSHGKMVPPTLRILLSTPVKSLRKHPHRYSQRFVSWVILSPIKVKLIIIGGHLRTKLKDNSRIQYT